MTDTPVASNFPPKLKENPTNSGLNWNLEMIIRKLRSWEKTAQPRQRNTDNNSKDNLNTKRVKLETDWWG